jgi:hypothetical protein
VLVLGVLVSDGVLVSVDVSLGVLVSVDVSLGVLVSVDVSLGVLVSVGESVDELSLGDGESLGDDESAGDDESVGDDESLGAATALVLSVVLPPVTDFAEDVRTVDVVGGEPQTEAEVATDACAAKAVTKSSAAPKNASPIAAPSAVGLRSSRLTVQPRFDKPV